MAKIGIVMPVYNGDKYLAETIDSVLRQTFTDWELVIVDDGSKDESAALAKDYAARDERIRVIQQQNAGVAAARNRGLGQMDASTEYVIFFDQDDLWAPDTLEALSKALADAPHAVAAHGLMHSIDERGQLCAAGYFEDLERNRHAIVGNRPVVWPSPRPTTFAVLTYMNAIVTPGQVLIRRQVLDTVGPFDSSTVPADDWDMWLRLSSHGDIALVDNVVLYWRLHGNNNSAHREGMHHAGMRVYRKLLDSPQLLPEQRRLVRPGYRWARRHYGDLYWGWAKENLAHGRWLPAIKQARHVVIELIHFYIGGTKLLPPR